MAGGFNVERNNPVLSVFLSGDSKSDRDGDETIYSVYDKLRCFAFRQWKNVAQR